MTIAWIFPGQGSQKLGMADSIVDLNSASDRFEFASENLGRDLLAICNGTSQKENPFNDLNDTRNTQPAMFVVESLLVDELKRQGREAAFVAGHSLGEISALYASEVLDFQSAFKLLKTRSELMADSAKGSMTAVMGFERGNLEDLVAVTEGVVIANDNSSDQVVLSGKKASIDLVAESLNAKRVIPLNVSGAFHSPFMENASKKFDIELEKVNFKDAIYSVFSNSEPTPTRNGELLKKRLKKQMTNGVRWREIMNNMKNEGVTRIIEIGPGKVLSGLAKRSKHDFLISQLSSASDLGY